jgi:hypothetical protein
VSSPSQGAFPGPLERKSAPLGIQASPAGALTSAFSHAVQLLLNPFAPRRWIKLSVVCLFLGGGATSAAFHWSLGTLPSDIGFQEALTRLWDYGAQHTWLILLAMVLGLSLAVALVYLRAICRFVLVDSILRGEILIRRALPATRPLAHSYFFWLLGALVAVGAALGTGILAVFPYLRTAAASGSHSVALSMTLAGLLLVQALVGLTLALVITLTDDLAVPIMYAERLPLLATWRKLWRAMRAEAGTFTLYIVLRFVVSVGVGIAVLFVLFPALVILFSGAIISAALVVLTLRVVGVAWVWTPFTIVLAGLALVLLMGLLLILLSVAGMPGQVFLQGFGMRFISPRIPALDALWRNPPPASQQG